MTQLPSKGPEKEIPWKRGCLQHWPITTAINNLTGQSEFKVNTRSLGSTAVFRLGAQSDKGGWGLRRSSRAPLRLRHSAVRSTKPPCYAGYNTRSWCLKRGKTHQKSYRVSALLLIGWEDFQYSVSTWKMDSSEETRRAVRRATLLREGWFSTPSRV